MVTEQCNGPPADRPGPMSEPRLGNHPREGLDACEQALEDICIPEEDSRLHARARVDFGYVSINSSISAAIAGNFSMRIHVPRALQQQICGNGLVGSVLGSMRITADISERVGNGAPAQCDAPELCLFVDFHQATRGSWMVDLRVLRGARLRVPLRIHAPTSAALPSKAAKSVLRSGSPVAVGSPGYVDLSFDADASTSLGPITIPGGAVADLWRSIRDEVRTMLAERVASMVLNEARHVRTAARGSLRSGSNEPGRERCDRVVCLVT